MSIITRAIGVWAVTILSGAAPAYASATDGAAPALIDCDFLPHSSADSKSKFSIYLPNGIRNSSLGEDIRVYDPGKIMYHPSYKYNMMVFNSVFVNETEITLRSEDRPGPLLSLASSKENSKKGLLAEYSFSQVNDYRRNGRCVTYTGMEAEILYSGFADVEGKDSFLRERRPRVPHSVANKTSMRREGGLLFAKVQNIIAATVGGDDLALMQSFGQGVNGTLSNFDGAKLQEQDFTPDVVRAIVRSCEGPYFADESATWVQMSWICNADPSAPIASFLKFRNSPELTLMVSFDGNQIRYLNAIEVIPVPMSRMFPMNTYSTLQSSAGTP